MTAPVTNTVGRTSLEREAAAFEDSFVEFRKAMAKRDALHLAETLMLASGDIKAAADTIVHGYRYQLPASSRARADAKAAAQRVLTAIAEYEHQIEQMTEEA